MSQVREDRIYQLGPKEDPGFWGVGTTHRVHVHTTLQHYPRGGRRRIVSFFFFGGAPKGNSFFGGPLHSWRVPRVKSVRVSELTGQKLRS